MICVMPACQRPATVRNRAGQDTCAAHQTVVVSGSYVGAEMKEDQ